MPNGGAINIKFEESITHFIIQITDSGVGIPKENLPHVMK